MTGYLLDTHAWIWALDEQDRLSGAASAALGSPGRFAVSAVSFYEVAQKARIGKWPRMLGRMQGLAAASVEAGFEIEPAARADAVLAGEVDWPHRDFFDRIIAAAALERGMVLVTRDDAFRTLPGLRTLW